jgi:hypothetical protein
LLRCFHQQQLAALGVVQQIVLRVEFALRPDVLAPRTTYGLNGAALATQLVQTDPQTFMAGEY